MTTMTIVSLLGLTSYLAMRLFLASSENAALRTHVAALKRRIAQLH
jgi:hypothetical protein